MAQPILLVHGAWHSSACWDNVIPLLQEKALTVQALDLPGRGKPPTSFKGICLETHVEATIAHLREYHTKVILVGHSFGGVVISQVAERVPEWVDRLIYIAAFVPLHGLSLTDEASQSLTAGVSTELIVDLKNNAVTLTLSPQVAECFYHLCPSVEVPSLLATLQAEPYRPFIDNVTLTASRFGQIRKYYLVCDEDKTVPSRDQLRMAKQHGCVCVHLPADHSPFYSMPATLAEYLHRCSVE